jgi:hypothetical protein
MFEKLCLKKLARSTTLSYVYYFYINESVNQGILPEGEGSVKLTSFLVSKFACFALKVKKKFFLIQINSTKQVVARRSHVFLRLHLVFPGVNGGQLYGTFLFSWSSLTITQSRSVGSTVVISCKKRYD